MRTRRRATEIPPTAGLPPRLADLWPARGPALDERAAAFLGVDAVQVECSGTAALVVALETLRRGSSDRRAVVVPAYTCPLVAFAVAHCGLELRPCDLIRGGIDFDPVALERCCDGDVLAVVPTHLGGRVAELGPTLAVARRVGAFVIEDAAQAFGARAGGRSVGLEGDIGFFSLAVGKGLTTYEGGLMIARDAALRAGLAATSRERVPRSIGWELRRSAELLAYHLLYRPRPLRFAYGHHLRRALRRGDPVAAVGDDFDAEIPLHTLGAWRRGVGARAFRRLPRFLADGASRARARVARLAAIRGVHVVGDAAGGEGTWPFFMLVFDAAARRDAVLEELWGAGVGVSRLFIHALPDYADLGRVVGPADVPNARAFAASMLTLSNSPWLDDATFAEVVERIERIAGG